MNPSSKLRALSVFATFAAISAFPAHAILDTNNNGLSDLWEKQHNNGNLFPNTFLATNDDDKDGWTNAKEAIAGTDPFNPNPPDGIVAVEITASLVPGAFTLTWPTLIGKNYQLQVSTDLITWSNLGAPITTHQNTHTIGLNTTQPDNTIPANVFWQVAVTDLDSDGDGLTNTEENTLGTNPNNADTDGDTLNDKAEILATTNPLDEDTDEDGLADNLDATPLQNDAIADPDGVNLAAHLNNHTTATNGVRLIARYDFEALPTGANNDLPSSVPTIPAATATHVGIDRFSNPSGMPSFTCQWNNAPAYNEYLSLPHHILDDRTKHTWSYWLKLPKNAFIPTAQNTGISTLLSIGINQYAPSYPGTSSPLPALHWYCDIATGMIRAETYQVQIGTPAMLGSGWTIPAAWNDGEWHHIVLHKSDNNYKIYFDGVDLGNRSSNNINLPLSTNSYTLIGRRDLTATTATNTAYRFPAGSRLDRLRCYTALTAADVLALYNQDIDRDDLFDRTESRVRYWNDRNANGVRNADESDYILRPFHHDAIGTDHDRDGIPSHNEQNGPVTSHSGNFDTDGDLLPDGWEKLHNLPYNNPAAPPNTHQDLDNDGASNFQEYLAGSNPHDPDTDDDGTNDGPEINQHSNATDPSDQGQAPDLTQTYSLRLGVGDQSSSQSERYQLIVYEYDWSNHTERQVHRLAAQTYGDYVEQTLPGLDPLSTYTFQIKWIGTNLGYNAQADFDYTFRVENPDPNILTSISEVFDPETASFEQGSILGQKNNITNFLISTEPKRAIAETLLTDFAVDTDMDGKIESLYRQRGNVYVPDQSKQDRDLLENDPQRAVIIDVNNNNTDSGTSSSGKAIVDNTDSKLDSQKDKTEITDGTSGHCFGRIRLWCWPTAELGIPWKSNQPAKYKIKLSYEDPAQANYVRVFGPDDVATDNSKPDVYIGPGKTEHFIDAAAFFTETPFRSPTLQTSHRYLVAEGITYGTATIKLEIIDIATNTAVGPPQIVRITTNVDRVEQKPADVAAKKDALHLRGVAPHHFGVRKPGQSTAGIRAIKGKLTIRLPSSNAGNNARLTPMDGRKLKQQQQTNNQTDSGGSFWIGLTQSNASGVPEQWVQTGVRWVQPPDELFASPPALYLELGDTFKSLGAKVLSQASTNHSDRTWLGGGVTNAANAILSGWHNDSKELDFILFKPIGPKEEDGSDKNIENWNVIFKDQNGNYLRFDRSNPNPPPNVSVSNDDQNELKNRYKKQQIKHIDCLFETNNSITLTVGTTNSQGSFSNLQYAGVYIAEAAAMPTGGSAAQIFDWAESNFSWINTSFNSSASEVKTGKWSFDSAGNTSGAANGTHEHPYWRKTVTPTSVHIWDLRNYGYNAAQ